MVGFIINTFILFGVSVVIFSSPVFILSLLIDDCKEWREELEIKNNSIYKRFKQSICRHDFKYIAKHRLCSENLWICSKCRVFYIQHYGLGFGFESKTPVSDNWDYEK
ncbi:MAG: hypothetical protein E6182_10200 [Clostridioides difficile]|nr:hypothetical protein [Clostridioides difficile]